MFKYTRQCVSTNVYLRSKKTFDPGVVVFFKLSSRASCVCVDRWSPVTKTGANLNIQSGAGTAEEQSRLAEVTLKISYFPLRPFHDVKRWLLTSGLTDLIARLYRVGRSSVTYHQEGNNQLIRSQVK